MCGRLCELGRSPSQLPIGLRHDWARRFTEVPMLARRGICKLLIYVSTRYGMDFFCNAMSLVPHDAGSLGVVVDEVFSDGKSGGADTGISSSSFASYG